MELKVLNKEGKETGRTVVLNDEVFGIEPNDHVIYLAVKQFLAAYSVQSPAITASSSTKR